MNKLSVRDVDVAGRKALVRVDFNVPLDENLQITDDTRIRASLPTIRYLLENGAAVILMSHLGRPKGGPNPKYSLKPTATRLQELLGEGTTVKFAGDTIGYKAREAAEQLKPGEVLILENLRFQPGDALRKGSFDLGEPLFCLRCCQGTPGPW